MLFIFRAIFVVIYYIVMCILGCLHYLFSPRNPKHVAAFGHLFGRLSPVFGLKVELRKPADAENYGSVVHIANHRSNYDMATASNIVQPPTVTVGKKSLLWIPLFGQLYWLTGNLLVDRNNRTEAHDIIVEVVNAFKKRKISFWMFPGGTRSRGRGLLPFKTGTFHAAIATGVPVVPVCASDTSNRIKLNRWNNSLMITEMLSPVDINQFGKNDVCVLVTHCREPMVTRVAELDNKVTARKATGKS